MKPLLRSPLLLLFALPALSQTSVDPALVAEINQIKAVDNHAHPMAVTVGETEDTEFDAIPCGSLEFTSPPPLRLRFDNPIYAGAWRELYGYRHGADMSEANVRELLTEKRRVQREQGDNYPAWVLDRLSIQTMFANRPRAGLGLTEPRFRWVAYGDPLTLPLSTRQVREANSDTRFFFSREETLLKLYLETLGLKIVPKTLDEYLARIVTPTLERLKRERAVAVKFVAAYMRPLSFVDTPEAEAARIYRENVGGAEPSLTEYRKLQDFLFRYVAREALAIALTGMMSDGDITRERASELARMVLRDNATRLYGL